MSASSVWEMVRKDSEVIEAVKQVLPSVIEEENPYNFEIKTNLYNIEIEVIKYGDTIFVYPCFCGVTLHDFSAISFNTINYDSI